MRVVFAALGGKGWTGGITYQRNLLEALRRYAPQVEAYLLAQDNPESPAIDDQFRVIQYRPSEYGIALRLLSKVFRQLAGYDLLLRQALRAIPGGGADVIFSGEYSSGRRTALLCWIPDFQHLRLPEMFAPADILARDRKLKQAIGRATLVVLSSQDALRDFRDFAPQRQHKPRVMHFVACPPYETLSTDPTSVVVRYGLPERFFYLPNQFWRHKNHAIVLEALRILNSRGTSPFVVCTGNLSDYRHPTYLAELMQKISSWGLRDQVAVLGLVPHEDVYQLIRQSACVLNPSLFEGWSTTVEEVKSTGKRTLLSNLAVHREQNPPAATYFDPHDAEDLADKMAAVWSDAPPGPDLQLEQIARSELPKRMQEYAETFVSIAQEAIDIAKGRRGPPRTVGLPG